MEDESHNNTLPNGFNTGSPESPFLKTSTTTTQHNKEQDRFLPIANVGRIMKKVIPPNGKISKDAKESREASDCKSPSWPRKALPTHYSSHPRPKGKKASV